MFFEADGTALHMESNPAEFKLAPGIQPYLKLHGSVNWKDGSFGGYALGVTYAALRDKWARTKLLAQHCKRVSERVRIVIG
jgi:hypothetical protein